MKLITITGRKTGETTRQVDPEPVGIDYKPLAAELARELAGKKGDPDDSTQACH